MSFQPAIPIGGVAGYRLLIATEDTQRAAFDRRPDIQREVDYFVENIVNVQSAEELVADRRLLTVALGAFGMDEDIDKRAFIRRILEEGSESSDAFANRFVDPRYQRLARAFGFGDFLGSRTAEPGFGAFIGAEFRERQFEIAVGDQDPSIRLAISFRREILTYANAADPEGTAWFSAMGDLPTRRVLEGALGLPSAVSQLDIDRQRDEFRDAASKTFGSRSLEIFNDPEVLDKAVIRFLARESAANGPALGAPGSTALTLLSQSNGLGGAGIQGLVLSSAL